MIDKRLKSTAVFITAILILTAALISTNWQRAGAQQDTPDAAETTELDGDFDEYDEYDDYDFDELDEDEWLEMEAAEDVLYELSAELIGVSIDDLFTELDSGKSIADVATANGVDPQTVIDALVADANTFIDELEAEGEITVEEAAEWREETPAEMAYIVNEVYVDPFVTVTQLLGIDEETLWAALESGQSVADLAAENGVALQTIVDALVAAENEMIDQEVEAGFISEEEAAEWRAEIADEINELVNESFDDWGEYDDYDDCGDFDDDELEDDEEDTNA